MRYLYFLFLFVLTACTGPAPTSTTAPAAAPSPFVAASSSPYDFVLDLGDEGTPLPPDLLDHVTSSDATVTIDDGPYGRNLKMTTTSEFSDLFLDTEALFGHPIDFTRGGYLRLQFLVPPYSWISALKLNFRDAEGNFGGIGEVANDFGEQERDGYFRDVVIHLDSLLPTFTNWHGETSPLGAVTAFSINPYNADQSEGQDVYLHRIEFSPTRPEGTFDTALLPHPAEATPTDPNRYHFTFDDREALQPQMAYRTFESSSQAFATGIGGNPTRAIKCAGRPDLNNIAFLPIIERMTGSPADFTRVDSIYFDYYIPESSASFDGVTLWIVSEHWNDILMDDRALEYADFTIGEWSHGAIAIGDLNLVRAKGTAEVLPNVYEWRMNFNYREGEKDVVVWLDNVGWK